MDSLDVLLAVDATAAGQRHGRSQTGTFTADCVDLWREGGLSGVTEGGGVSPGKGGGYESDVSDETSEVHCVRILGTKVLSAFVAKTRLWILSGVKKRSRSAYENLYY